jgi:hypothetical protein
MKWILEDVEGMPENKILAEKLNTRVLNKRQLEDQLRLSDFKNEKFIFRGSLESAKKFAPFLSSQLCLKHYECSFYYPRTPNLLNSDCIFLPWSLLSANKELIFKAFPDSMNFFIRPDYGSKEFTGTTISKTWFDKDLEIIKSLPGNNIYNDLMVLISSAKNIKNEYRLLVNDAKEIIDHSIYDNDINFELYHKDIKYIQKELIDKINFCPDPLFTVDVALLGNTGYKYDYRIVEINSFTCSGLYNMDLDKVINEVERLYQE